MKPTPFDDFVDQITIYGQLIYKRYNQGYIDQDKAQHYVRKLNEWMETGKKRRLKDL